MCVDLNLQRPQMPPPMRDRFGADEARHFYDLIGVAQDTQAFYENAAVERLLAEGRVREAQRVLEVGCGTGRIAVRLLSEELPSDAEYLGIDVSATMVRLSRDRLARWPRRARVLKVPGGHEGIPVADRSMDRVLTTYVMDLMTDEDRAWTLGECHRVLRKGGLLCHAGLAPGEGPLTSMVSAIWGGLHKVSPWLVGGCRPLVLSGELPATLWSVRYAERVARFGITSEVVVAEAI